MRWWLLLMIGTSFSVHASPQTFLPGATVEITCQVPKQPDNILLKFGISDIGSSERDLYGLSSPVYWGPFAFKHVGCAAEFAFCEVYRRDGSHGRVIQRLSVAGCEP